MSGWSVKPGAAHVAALLLVALAASGCSEKKVVVDPNDGVEGVASSSQLVVWNETPTVVSTYADTLTPGPNLPPDPPDRLLGEEEVFRVGPGNIHGMIFDYTRASRFDILRDAGSGFRAFKDFQLDAQRRYLFSHTDLFQFIDPLPVALQRYVGRGIVSGVTTPLSPKTNVGRVSLGAVAGDLQFTAPTGIPPDFRPPPDSLLFMSWNPYPGAAGYWVHVYQFTTQGGQEIILSGVPAPFYFSNTRDYFLAFFPSSVTSYRLGLKPDGTPIGPVPPGAQIVEEQHLINNQIYNVRVSAVNDQGELIAFTGSAGSFLIFRQETTYRRFQLGAVLMNTRSIVPPPSPTEPLQISGAAPGVWYVPPGHLNRPR